MSSRHQRMCISIRLARSTGGQLRSRAAFTLVEMLVAITIFGILAALTVGSFRGVNKNDQISAAAQITKGWFEHARSAALKDKQPRGIRFLADTTSSSGSSPRLCTAVAYIGGAGYEDGNLTLMLPSPPSPPNTPNLPERKYAWVQSVDLPGFTAGTILSPGGAAFNQPPTLPNHPGYATYVAWQAARESGGLTDATASLHGLRVEIPRNSGNWYPILGVSEDRNGNGSLEAAEDLNLSEDTMLGGNPTGRPDPVIILARPVANAAQYANRPVDYRIELGPTLLADSQPSPLPRGIVIDLDASYVPQIWRPTTLGGGYSAQMDVMFSPNGTFAGQLAAAQGIIHLCLSTLEDANAARLPFVPPSPLNHPENATSTSDLVYPFILADAKTTQKVVSVFLNTGRVASSDLLIFGSGDPASDGVNNTRLGTAPGYSDAFRAFKYAVQGKEAR